MLSPAHRFQIAAAIDLIARTPDYEAAAAELAQRLESGRIAFLPSLIDRGQATLSGVILVGPEAMAASALSLAETLIHEQYHLHQFPLLKTVSFWSGIATRTPVMRRYERPAYETALRFLDAAARAHPALAGEAHEEMAAVAAAFAAEYGGELLTI